MKTVILFFTGLLCFIYSISTAGANPTSTIHGIELTAQVHIDYDGEFRIKITVLPGVNKRLWFKLRNNKRTVMYEEQFDTALGGQMRILNLEELEDGHYWVEVAAKGKCTQARLEIGQQVIARRSLQFN
jgi:hypothetical protein